VVVDQNEGAAQAEASTGTSRSPMVTAC